MDNNIIGMFAQSRSGHDKGEVYVIIREEEMFVYLADGRLRPISKCKKKNRRHIQIIHKSDDILQQKLQSGETVRDEEIKRAIKLFRQKDAK